MFLLWGFFAIKTGSIFGMFSYGKPYVETKGDGTADVVTIPDDKLKVTGQEDYSSVLTVLLDRIYRNKFVS